MNLCAYLSRSYVISAPLGLFRLSAYEVDRRHLGTVSTVLNPRWMSGAELFVRGKVNTFWLICRGQRQLRSAICRKPATSSPPPPPSPPPSCCAPIKAELIKPQLIASAGGGRRRKKGERGSGGGVHNYTLPFTYHPQCIVHGWRSPLNAHASLLPPCRSSSVLREVTGAWF